MIILKDGIYLALTTCDGELPSGKWRAPTVFINGLIFEEFEGCHG